MAGIAGLALSPGIEPDRDVLERMATALARRGGAEVSITRASGIGLVHTRSAHETGPESAGARVLLLDGVPQPREAGTEASPGFVLARHAERGADFAASLAGGFALALHDRAGGEVLLARDGFGARPLVVAEIPGGFAFASEAQALRAAGFGEAGPDPLRRAELLQVQFTTGEATIYPGLRRILPGETVVLAQGRVVARRQHASLPAGPPASVAEGDPQPRLEAALASACLRGRLGGRCGVALDGTAGGLALLAALAAMGANATPCFAVRADGQGAEPSVDEAAFKALGGRLVEVPVGPERFWNDLPSIVTALDEPVADWGVVSTWAVAAAAASEVGTLLCPEGADELLAGYGRYRAALRPWWLGGRVMRARGRMDRLDLLRAEAGGSAWRDGLDAAAAQAAQPGWTRLQAAQANDLAEWLPNDRLLKLDRVASAHGLLAATPFLDPAVVEACFTLPDAQKLRRGEGVWPLRRWLGRVAPGFVARRQGLPVAAWIEAEAERLGRLVAASPGVVAIARPERVLALFRPPFAKHGGLAAWTLLFWALWHARHVEGRPLEGSVFDALDG